MSDFLVCPKCAKRTPGHRPTCIMCGETLHPDKICNGCGKKNPVIRQVCQYCGGTLSSPAAPLSPAAGQSAPTASVSSATPTHPGAAAAPLAALMPLRIILSVVQKASVQNLPEVEMQLGVALAELQLLSRRFPSDPELRDLGQKLAAAVQSTAQQAGPAGEQTVHEDYTMVADADPVAAIQQRISEIRSGSAEPSRKHVIGVEFRVGQRAAQHLLDKKEIAEAVIVLEELTRLAPWHFGVMLSRAQCLRALQRPAEAVPCYEAALKIDPRAHVAWFQLADMLDELNRVPESREAYRRATEAAPDNAQYWCDYGHSCNRMNNAAAALPCFVRATELDPNLVVAWFNRAEAERALRLPAMLTSYERFATLCPPGKFPTQLAQAQMVLEANRGAMRPPPKTPPRRGFE
jgi:tetratricopeptide (TPR) repeat protein